MFSTYYPGCGRDWGDCTLFPAIFRKAGYDVWFITNHYAGEKNNKDHHGHAGGTIFNQKRLRQLQFTYVNPEATQYDMELLSELPPADTLAARPSMVIFHMMGQHEDYRERYPEAFNHFTADSVQNAQTVLRHARADHAHRPQHGGQGSALRPVNGSVFPLFRPDQRDALSHAIASLSVFFY